MRTWPRQFALEHEHAVVGRGDLHGRERLVRVIDRELRLRFVDDDHRSVRLRAPLLDRLRLLRVRLLFAGEIGVDLALDDLVAREDLGVLGLEPARLLELVAGEVGVGPAIGDGGLRLDVLLGEPRVRRIEIGFAIAQPLLGIGRIEFHHGVAVLDRGAVRREPRDLHRPEPAVLRREHGCGLDRLEVALGGHAAHELLLLDGVRRDGLAGRTVCAREERVRATAQRGYDRERNRRAPHAAGSVRAT